mmetsp:Transcript_35922/g.102298  ORF Transcript_35922/g.102298 Transcript_35922/m.102298 type:complete len:96 (-) Transcript_35922:25-312(-)
MLHQERPFVGLTTQAFDFSDDTLGVSSIIASVTKQHRLAHLKFRRSRIDTLFGRFVNTVVTLDDHGRVGKTIVLRDEGWNHCFLNPRLVWALRIT